MRSTPEAAEAAAPRYFQEPSQNQEYEALKADPKQYSTMDKRSLDNVKIVTNSLKSETRNGLELCLQQNQEDLNLISRNGGTPNGLTPLTPGHGPGQHLSSMMGLSGSSQMSVFGNTGNSGNNLVVAVNDLKRTKENEKSHENRCSLSSLYRLIHLRGWDNQNFSQISMRVSEQEFLLSPFGLLYYEVTASKLMKVSASPKSNAIARSCKVDKKGSTSLDFEPESFKLNLLVHQARPEAKIVLFVNTSEVVACSHFLTTSKNGGLPIEGLTNVTGPVAICKVFTGESGKEKDDFKAIKSSFEKSGSSKKDKARVLLVRGLGACIAANGVEEAYYYLQLLVGACQTQVTMAQAKIGSPESSPKNGGKKIFEGVEKKAKVLYEANMRMLDNMGYRTGYRYSDGYDPVTYHVKNQQRLAREAQMANQPYERQVLTPEEIKREREADYHRRLEESKRSQSGSNFAHTPNKWNKRSGALSTGQITNGHSSTHNMSDSDQASNGQRSSVINIHDSSHNGLVLSSAINQNLQNSQGSSWVLGSDSTYANGPYKIGNLVPLNTDRKMTESVYKSVMHDETLVLTGTVPKNYVVTKQDHTRIKPSIEHRDNPFVGKGDGASSG